MSREQRYLQLVEQRKAYDPTPLGLHNPSSIDEGRYDSSHIGPWTAWAHDLEADLMVVGQDWGDVDYFLANRGFDKPENPTNKALAQLLATVGRPVPAPPVHGAVVSADAAACGVWLTNALLWLKTGGMSAPVKPAWFSEHSATLLRAQIELVEPRVVVALGQRAYGCIASAYGLPRRAGAYRRVVDDTDGVQLTNTASTSTLIGVYHCGARIQNTLRPLDQQLRDWKRVGRLLGAI